MRCNVHFKDVARIIPVTERAGAALPANIALASGQGRQDKRADAFRLFANNPQINTVVLIEQQREQIGHMIDLLDQACGALDTRSLRPKNLSHETAREKTEDYFIARRRHADVDAPALHETAMPITDFVQNMIDEVNPRLSAKALKTAFTYSRNYTVGRGEQDYINGHIDSKNEFNLREVECCEGSGTVLFADNDFEISNDDSAPFTLTLKNKTLTAWTVLPGSSVLMRVPSFEENTCCQPILPAIHSHGIGRDDGAPEQRLTFRHDFLMR